MRHAFLAVLLLARELPPRWISLWQAGDVAPAEADPAPHRRQQDKALRFGILGTSKVTRWVFGSALLAAPGLVELLAVASRSRERAELSANHRARRSGALSPTRSAAAAAEAFAREFNVSRVHDSYEALLADEEVDAVFLPLPPSLHSYWATKSMEAGKHVLVEKPLASNAAEVEQLLQVSRRTGLVCMENMRSYWEPQVLLLKALVSAGEVGAPRHYQYDRRLAACSPEQPRDARWDVLLGGGTMLDNGCYAVAALGYLAGHDGAPEESVPQVTGVHVVTARDYGLDLPIPLPEELDLVMNATLLFPSGITAGLTTTSYRIKGVQSKLEIRVDGALGSLYWRSWPASEIVRADPQGRTLKSWPLEGGRLDVASLGAVGSFVDAVRGLAPPPATLERSLQSHRVIDAVYRAGGLRPRGTHAGVAVS